MLTETLFKIAKIWRQPKSPSTEEQIKKTWYLYTMKYYSQKIILPQQRIMSFTATCMNLEIIILNEVRQRQISYDIIYIVESKKLYK